MRPVVSLLPLIVLFAVTSPAQFFGAVNESIFAAGPPPPPPTVPSPVVRKIIPTPDGKAVLFGSSLTDGNGNFNRQVVRVKGDGTLDSSFSLTTPTWILDATVDGMNRILLIREKPRTGSGPMPWPLLPGVGERYLQTGTLDPSFQVGSGSLSLLEQIHSLSDGAVLITGYLQAYNDQPLGRNAARLGGNGIVDTTFKPSFEGEERFVGGPSQLVAVVPLPSGEFLAGGYFPSVNGLPFPSLAKLRSGGMVDTNFAADLGLRGVSPWSGGQVVDLQPNVTAICRQADGQIVIAGEFTSVRGTARTNMARLNPDGSLDTSFNAGLAPLNIFSIAQQQDGKLLVAAMNYGYGRGTFSQFDGAPRSELARLLPDGTLDSSFNFNGQVNGAIFSVAVLTDGQIMVGGAFTSFAGVTCGGAVRINPNGFVTPVAPAINSQTVRRLGNNSFEFQLAAPTNQTVFIQTTTNLLTGPWVNIQTQTVSSGSLNITDSEAGQSVRRFYRVILR